MFETMISALIKKGSSSLLLLTFSGITLATSGVAGAKIYNQIKSTSSPGSVELQTEAQVLGVSTQSESEDIQGSTGVSGNSSFVSTGTGDSNLGNSGAATGSGLGSLLADSSTSSNTTNDFPAADSVSGAGGTTQSNGGGVVSASGSCIIQIFGKNYDIAPFRNKHAGGDVFKCGTDMSNAYKSAHGTNVSGLAIYETTADLASSDPSQLNNQARTSIGSFEHEEEKEDEEYHEEEERHYEDKEDDHDGDHDEDHREDREDD